MSNVAVWDIHEALPISELAQRDEPGTTQVEDLAVCLMLARATASLRLSCVHPYMSTGTGKRLYYKYFTYLVESRQKFNSLRTLI